MKLLIYSLISLALFTSCTSNEDKWNIKSIETISYSPIDKFGKITKGDVNRMNHSYNSNTRFEYDELGNVLVKDYLNTDLKVAEKCVMTYNQFDSIREEKYYDETGDLKYKWVNSYNSDNYKVSSRKEGPEVRDSHNKVFEYNSANQLIKSIDTRKDIDLHIRYEYKYNANNDIEEYISFFDDKRSHSYKFEYDKEGKITKRTRYNDEKKVKTIDSYTYDEKMNEILKDVIDHPSYGDGEPSIYQIKTDYIYDEKGNWVSKIVSRDSNPIYYFERKIKYFDEEKAKDATEPKDELPESDDIVKNEKADKQLKFSCSEASARFRNSKKHEVIKILGKPNESYSSDYWFYLVYLNKVTDKFDNNKTKHLCFKIPTILNSNADRPPIIECLEKGDTFPMGGSYLRMP